MNIQQLSKTEKHALARIEIAKWFDHYHQDLITLRHQAHQQNLPLEIYSFTKSQAERFSQFPNEIVKAKPRLKCMVFLTSYHLSEVEQLIETYHQLAIEIIEKFELRKHPKLLEKPLIFEDVVAVNFTKNPAISILKTEPDEVLEWYQHQLDMIQEHLALTEHKAVNEQMTFLEHAMKKIKLFKAENDGSRVLKRFYQSGFSYRATLRFASQAKQVISLNEFLFIVSHYEKELPFYGDSTLLPYSRKKRADTILKSDRNIVAETTNELHYYFWEPIKK